MSVKMPHMLVVHPMGAALRADYTDAIDARGDFLTPAPPAHLICGMRPFGDSILCMGRFECGGSRRSDSERAAERPAWDATPRSLRDVLRHIVDAELGGDTSLINAAKSFMGQRFTLPHGELITGRQLLAAIAVLERPMMARHEALRSLRESRVARRARLTYDDAHMSREFGEEIDGITGYGTSLQTLLTFLSALEERGVKLVVDVRTRPQSQWHPHFNRKALERSLAVAGIGYAWLGDRLGGYPEGYDGDFERYMQDDPEGRFTQGIAELRVLSKEYGLTAVICSEGDENNCHRRFILQHLRDNRSIRDIPLEDLAHLSPAETLIIAEQLFDEARKEYGVLMKRGVSFHMGTRSARAGLHLMRWAEQRLEWFGEVEARLLKRLPASDEMQLRNYMSSYRQLLQVGVSKLYTSTKREVPDAVRDLQREANREVMIDGGRGYRVGLEHSEIAFAVAIGLKENAIDYAWHGTRLSLRLPIEGLKHSMRFELLDRIAWPPTSDDPVLAALQRILGWQFDVETSDDHVTIAIDFGASYVEK